MPTIETLSNTASVTIEAAGRVELTFTERGEGRPVLLLHGGGGPQTVAAFADLLAATPARVITPTHPGFAGTPRPEQLASIETLASAYALLLQVLDLRDVTVIGNSIGGWIAAEMALTGTNRISAMVIVDAVGIEVPGHPVADFFSLTMAEVAELSYHDPDTYRIDVDALPPAARTTMAGNRAALAAYAGQQSMVDPTLAGRLAAATVPTLVLWGEADRIADPDYGRAYAAAIPAARFQLLPDAGHLPQLETPHELARSIRAFIDTTAT